MDKETLKNYFSTHWVQSRTSGLENYTYTGYSLADKVREGECVLDVGCGTNPFKDILPCVWGIDITDIGADEVVGIEDFTNQCEKKFDVAFCLGSINFGTEETIRRQIQAVVDNLKPNGRIYWRVNPGLQDHANNHVNEIEFFPWNLEYMINFAKDFGFTLVHWARESSGHKRFYAEWRRNNDRAIQQSQD